MRITGFGGWGGGGSKGQGRDRADAFRRRHRVGERVTGRVLRHESTNHAWVDFEGIELLAGIQSAPAPGSVLLFVILRTEPDILLQELQVARAAGDPLSGVADAFWAARARFESLSWDIRTTAGKAAGGPNARERAFRAALDDAPDAAKVFALAEEAVDAANGLLALRGGMRLGYRPWLLPETLSGETITMPPSKGGITETAHSFTFPGHGQCELRLMEGAEGAGARLLLESMDLAPAFEKLVRLRGLVSDDQDFFTPAPLPLSARAGVLAPLLAAGHGDRPRFARRV